MKKSKILILALALALIMTALVSCTYVPTVDADVITMITIDADASVEFMVNPKNKVASATPLNDIAAIIMSGESFVGKKPDEAAAQFVSLAARAGLLAEGGLTTVKLSVSGESDYVDVITKLITKKMLKSMKKEGVKGEVQNTLPMTEEELLAICLENNYIPEDNAAYATYNYLVYSLANQRVGYAEFPTEETSLIFRLFKDLDFDLIIKEETLKDLETVKDSYPEVYNDYKEKLDDYKSCAEEFKAYCVAAYLSSSSDYAKALAEMRDAKEEAIRSGNASSLDAARGALADVDLAIKEEIEKYEKNLGLKKADIEEIEGGFINHIEIERHMRQTYMNRQARVRTAISTYASEFSDKFNAQLTAVKDELAARKKNIIK